jgi:uncharacterized membrane protein HdeD (DUF308 family)
MVDPSKRGLNILVGSLFIILGIIGFFFPVGFFWVLMVINSIAMIIWGIALVIERPLKIQERFELERTAALIVGIVLIILGAIILIGSFTNEVLAAELYIYFFVAVLIIAAIYTILWGLKQKKKKKRWGMGLISIFLAILLLIFAVLILFIPIVGVAIVIFFVAIAMIILGARNLLIGIFPETAV